MIRLICLIFVLASTVMALPGGLHAQILGQEGAAHQSRVHAPTGVSRTFGTVDEAVVTLTASDFAPLLTANLARLFGRLVVRRTQSLHLTGPGLRGDVCLGEAPSAWGTKRPA